MSGGVGGDAERCFQATVGFGVGGLWNHVESERFGGSGDREHESRVVEEWSELLKHGVRPF